MWPCSQFYQWIQLNIWRALLAGIINSKRTCITLWFPALATVFCCWFIGWCEGHFPISITARLHGVLSSKSLLHKSVPGSLWARIFIAFLAAQIRLSSTDSCRHRRQRCNNPNAWSDWKNQLNTVKMPNCCSMGLIPSLWDFKHLHQENGTILRCATIRPVFGTYSISRLAC